MDFFQAIYDWIIGFFGIEEFIRIIKSGDYSSFLTYKGFISIIGPLFPIVLVAEVLMALLYKKFKAIDYKISFFSYVLNSFIGRLISIAAVVFCIGLFEKYAIFKTTFTWYWFIYGYIVWEFGHFIYHYWGHKVRLFWCLHSTHHTPQTMHLAISYAHFFLEAPYAGVIRTTVCIILGVNPPMLAVIMFIDGFWGGFIHIGEQMVKDGKLGFLHKFILTPSHHRVHHAKNPLYMDTNFCNLLNIWDRIFGTYQPEDRNISIQYGITRKMKPNSFIDSYFGEFGCLAKDIIKAPGIKNKILYIFMPPGWSHTGEDQTADKVRNEFIKTYHPDHK
ncbi:MAG TPA: sterol desaturase family protein [Chitinophagaceae bacterium]|nr:sterol desaturase family protein [Chitinophagaceae bacterium]